jgi:hypothetical protein
LASAESSAGAQRHVFGTMAHVPVEGGARPGGSTARRAAGGGGLGTGTVSLREDGGGALASELDDERAAARKWKRKAEEYKSQLVSQKKSVHLSPVQGAREKRSSSSASSFSERLQAAREDADRWRRRADAYKIALSAQDGGDAMTKCDSKGCWTIDTSDPVTRATLHAFHTAAGASRAIKPPLDAVAAAANAAVEAKSIEAAAVSHAHAQTSLSDKPLKKALEKKCDNPYHHVDTAADACSYVHRTCPQASPKP